MSNISGINPAQGTSPIQPSSTPRASASDSSAGPQPPDTVEISQQARIAAKLASIPDVRGDLVSRVKGEIKAGTYDTPDKMDEALKNLLAEL